MRLEINGTMRDDSLKIDSVETMLRHWLVEMARRDRELDDLTAEVRALKDELKELYEKQTKGDQK